MCSYEGRGRVGLTEEEVKGTKLDGIEHAGRDESNDELKVLVFGLERGF